MLRNPAFAITTVSLYLLLYIVSAQLKFPVTLILSMFAFSPILVAWMVYTVIRNGTYSVREFEDAEEWGYKDKNKEDLGII